MSEIIEPLSGFANGFCTKNGQFFRGSGIGLRTGAQISGDSPVVAWTGNRTGNFYLPVPFSSRNWRLRLFRDSALRSASSWEMRPCL